MADRQSWKVRLGLLLAVVDQAVFLSAILLLLNFAVFQLLGLLAGYWVFEALPWVLTFEGLYIAMAAVLDLTHRGDLARRFFRSITWTMHLGWHARYYELIRADEKRLGRSVVTGVVVLLGSALFALGFLLLAFIVTPL
jgi:hypothetical protein